MNELLNTVFGLFRQSLRYQGATTRKNRFVSEAAEGSRITTGIA